MIRIRRTFKLSVLTLSVAFTMLLSTTGCLERVAIPVTPDQIETKKFVYVTLSSGLEYRLENPEIRNGVLVGIVEDIEVKIALADVQTIEVVQQDKKKIILGTAIGAATILALGLVLSTQTPIHIGSVD